MFDASLASATHSAVKLSGKPNDASWLMQNSFHPRLCDIYRSSLSINSYCNFIYIYIYIALTRAHLSADSANLRKPAGAFSMCQPAEITSTFARNVNKMSWRKRLLFRPFITVVGRRVEGRAILSSRTVTY